MAHHDNRYSLGDVIDIDMKRALGGDPVRMKATVLGIWLDVAIEDGSTARINPYATPGTASCRAILFQESSP